MESLWETEQQLLAEVLRPQTSAHLVGTAATIWKRDLLPWIRSRPFHCALWGPPGCGKTTLARLLARESGRVAVQLSAVRDGVRTLREAADRESGGLIFIDEIHRLNKAQQDVLLPIMEESKVWIMGATTENPAVSLNPAILSRMRLIHVKAPSSQDLRFALLRALDYLWESGASPLGKEFFTRLCEERLAVMAAGDVRLALNLLEAVFHGENTADVEEILKQSQKAFARKEHYDWVSAMIKSMRGSDPDAALFYAITAVESGEDPVFVLRRCLVFASEDIGNADPSALPLAVAALEAVRALGLPEALYPLGQCVTYLASTVKSVRVTQALARVKAWAKACPQAEPRRELTRIGMAEYQYPPDFPESFVKKEYLPHSVAKERDASGPAYLPSSCGAEKLLQRRLEELWGRRGS